MTDLSDKKLESDEHQQQQTSEENEKAKKCADCGTSKTPLWRGGPAGPKSLCNACGIRSRKKVRVSSGIKTEKARAFSSTKKSSGSGSSTTTTTTTSSSSGGGGGSSCSTLTTSSSNDKSSRLVGSLNQRLISLGREVMMQRSTVGKRSVRKNNNNNNINININKLGEDEQAAVLLMALSYGSVYA